MTKVKVEPSKPPHTAVDIQPESLVTIPHNPTRCWYVMGIISSILCFMPFGVIGLVHAMMAQHEGERGNLTGHRRRLYQAKCWISWSIALMFVIIIGSLLIYGDWLGWFIVERVDYWYGTGLYSRTTPYPSTMSTPDYYSSWFWYATGWYSQTTPYPSTMSTPDYYSYSYWCGLTGGTTDTALNTWDVSTTEDYGK